MLDYEGCVDGDIRLVGGATALEGRVEVCRNFLWGSVCESYWDIREGQVVCRQLGYSTAGTQSHTTHII